MVMTILRRLFVLMAFYAATMSAKGNAAEPPQPLIVAHRGLLHHAPENTLANFRACLELRLGFEFDVERSKKHCRCHLSFDQWCRRGYRPSARLQTDFSFAVSQTILKIDRLNTGIKDDSLGDG